jgi:hypothetical protein
MRIKFKSVEWKNLRNLPRHKKVDFPKSFFKKSENKA